MMKTKIVSLALICLFLLTLLGISLSNRGLCEEWTVEILSVESGKGEGIEWTPCEQFYRTETVSFRFTVINRDSVAHDVELTVTVHDELNVPVGVDSEVVSISAETTIQMYLSVTIPTWAYVGLATAHGCAFKVPEGTPWCSEATDDFWILGGSPPQTGFLTVRAFTTYGVQVYGIGIQVDGVSYTSPVTVEVEAGVHTVKAQARWGNMENGVLYIYEFRYWEDGSTANPRTVNVPQGESVAVTAYYFRYRSRYQPV